MSYIMVKISKQKVHDVIEDVYYARLKPMSSMTICESFDSMIEHKLCCAQDISGQYAQKNLKEDNNVKPMATADSKGSYINISKMSICIGQQSVEGKHIPFGFHHRTLPHFNKDDFSPRPGEFVFARVDASGVLFPCYGRVRGAH